MKRRTALITLAESPFLAGCTAVRPGGDSAETVTVEIRATGEWELDVQQSNYEATEATDDSFSGTGDDTVEFERELENVIITAKSGVEEADDEDGSLELRVIKDGAVVDERTMEQESRMDLLCAGDDEFACEPL